METKINIAKILKNKPEGTKLWTDMFGSVTLYVVTDACDAFQVKHHNKEPWFDEDGKLYKEEVNDFLKESRNCGTDLKLEE